MKLLLILLFVVGLRRIEGQHTFKCLGGFYRWTHVVASLLRLVTLLVGLGLGLIRLALLGAECLPSLTENLAYLA